jgi:hypothetical protein
MNTQGVEPGAPAAGSPEGDDRVDQGNDGEFAAMAAAQAPRSHRRGMLAGLGAVGLLLAVLLLFGSGGSGPRLAAPSQHGGGPVTIPVRTTDPAAATTTSAPQLTVPTAPAGHGFVTNASVRTSPRSAPTTTAPTSPGRPTPSTASSSTTTTAPVATPPPTSATTTTTSPAPTTTTTTSCILVVICG